MNAKGADFAKHGCTAVAASTEMRECVLNEPRNAMRTSLLTQCEHCPPRANSYLDDSGAERESFNSLGARADTQWRDL